MHAQTHPYRGGHMLALDLGRRPEVQTMENLDQHENLVEMQKVASVKCDDLIRSSQVLRDEVREQLNSSWLCA